MEDNLKALTTTIVDFVASEDKDQAAHFVQPGL